MSAQADTDEVISNARPAPPTTGSVLPAVCRRHWNFALVAALAVVLWLPRLGGPIDLRWDAGVYYVLGTSLATGQGYRILSEPGSPKALQYPPLLPGAVALVERALGSTNPDVVAPWLRKLYCLLFIAYAVSTLALARRYLPVSLAVAAAALVLLQVNTLFLSDLLFTELPFALISVIFVLVAGGQVMESRPWVREALSFLIAAAGFLLRTAGLALLVAWIAEAMVRRRWKLVLTRAALSLVPLFAWQAYVAHVRGSYEYAHPAYEYQRAPYQFYNVSYAENVGTADLDHPGSRRTHTEAFVSRIKSNALHLLKGLGEAVSTSEGYWRQCLSLAQQKLIGRQFIPLSIVLIPIAFYSLLVLGGIAWLLRCGAWLMFLVIIVSLGLICTTPWPGQFQRYLMPVTPFLVIAAVLAVSQLFSLTLPSLSGRSSHVARQILIGGAVLLPLLVETFTASEIFRLRKQQGAAFVAGRGPVGPHFFYHELLWRGWEEAVAWIDKHSAPDSIIATPASHLCYLRTGRHAVSPPIEADPSRASNLLKSVPVSYVIVDRGYKLPAVERDSASWHLIQSFDGTKLYERSLDTGE
jgi:hypothetical protein